jgi:hypothetical protein
MPLLEPAITATTRTGSWLISELRRAGALSPETAQPVRIHDFSMDYTLGQLVRTGIVREAARGFYFLDERVLAPVERRARRLRITIAVGGIAVLLAALVRIMNRL